jgi:hypothetical protein
LKTVCALGCQMVCFQTKNPKLGKFWRVLRWWIVGLFYGHLVYFIAIWHIYRLLGIFYGNLVYFPVLVSCSKKSGTLFAPAKKNKLAFCDLFPGQSLKKYFSTLVLKVTRLRFLPKRIFVLSL